MYRAGVQKKRARSHRAAADALVRDVAGLAVPAACAEGAARRQDRGEERGEHTAV